MNLYGLLDAIIKKVNRAVKVEKQELDSSLQKQARENINAPSKNEICNPNLLDNWYFLNPVNQKGQTTYNTVGYTIDRWTAAYGDISVSLNADGLQLISNGSNALIEQYLAEDLTGKTVCFSVLTDIGLFSETKVMDDLGYISPGVIPNIGQLEIFVSGGRTIFRIWLQTAGASLKLVAAKLEFGDAQTLARQDSNGNWVLNEIPKYSEESLKCRQYDPYTGKYIGLRKFSQPRNLLDNSDFSNPVNQRGQTSYSYGMSIDRWGVNYFGGVGTFNVNTMFFDISGEFCELSQVVADSERLAGKTVTLAAKTTDGNIYSYTFIFGQYVEVHPSQDVRFYALDSAIVILRSFNSAVGFEWAALYEGEYTADTLPEYTPKGYGAELAECMRYYQRSYVSTPNDGSVGYPNVYHVAASAYGAGSYLFPVEMRITPTVTLYAPATGASGYVSRWSTDGNVAALTNCTTKGFQVRSNAGAFAKGEVFVCHYEACADL